MGKKDFIKQYEEDLTPEMILALDLLEIDNWISVEDELPPKIIGLQFSDYYIVLCKNYDIQKGQTAYASYNHNTKEWTDHWQTLIEDVEFYIKPPKGVIMGKKQELIEKLTAYRIDYDSEQFKQDVQDLDQLINSLIKEEQNRIIRIIKGRLLIKSIRNPIIRMIKNSSEE